MDIIATGSGWGVGLGGLGGFKYAFDKEAGTLSVVLDDSATFKRDLFMVTTPRGVFIETVKDGEVIQDGGDGDWYHVLVGETPVALRYKALPDPNLSKGDLRKHRQKVTRYLVDDTSYSAGVPDTLVGVIKWAEELLAKIPTGSRKTAKCRFDTSTEYGETYPHVEVSYEEPESDEEVVARVKVDRELARIAEAKKRAQLQRLKAELEPAS